MVELPHKQAKTLVAAAGKAKIKVAIRRLDDATSGVWKL